DWPAPKLHPAAAAVDADAQSLSAPYPHRQMHLRSPIGMTESVPTDGPLPNPSGQPNVPHQKWVVTGKPLGCRQGYHQTRRRLPGLVVPASLSAVHWETTRPSLPPHWQPPHRAEPPLAGHRGAAAATPRGDRPQLAGLARQLVSHLLSPAVGVACLTKLPRRQSPLAPAVVWAVWMHAVVPPPIAAGQVPEARRHLCSPLALSTPIHAAHCPDSAGQYAIDPGATTPANRCLRHWQSS